MPLNGDLLFDLDAGEAEPTDERLLIAAVGSGKFMVIYEPTQSQTGAMLLALSGKKGDPSGAVRNFLDDVILSVADVQERLDSKDGLRLAEVTDEEVREAIEENNLVDLEFIFERMRDRERPLAQEKVTEFVRSILTLRSGFPTKPSSASTSSRPNTGQNSPVATRRVRSTPSR